MQKNKEYYSRLNWSFNIYRENDYYVLESNEIQGAAVSCKDLDVGIKDIKEVLMSIIEMKLESGDEIPEPIAPHKFNGKISYRTKPQIHAILAQKAKMSRKSMSSLLDEYVLQNAR